VIFESKAGLFPSDDDRVMEKVDDEGNVIGFSVMKVSSVKSTPLEVALP
jgi:hypothetical protein